MKNNRFNTPILLIIFNRPDVTQIVFNEIKKLKPAYLFITADGPRKDKPEDKKKCQEARSIIEQIDWECEVKTNFYDENLGCRKGVSSGINWFFEHVEEGIILEDDCVPSESFFFFCKELLEFYRNDSRVMHISGNNFQFGIKRGSSSYYFSKYAQSWGWATWKRAWEKFDVEFTNFKSFKDEEQIKNVFSDKNVQRYWIRRLQDVYDKKIDSWAYVWAYTVFSQNGLCIIPSVNLVSNIGFRRDSTHTKDENSLLANIPAQTICSLIHPSFIIENKEADNQVFYKIYYTSLRKRIEGRLKREFSKLLG